MPQILSLSLLKNVLALSPLVFSGFATSALAIDGLTVSGSVRARYETLTGQARAGFGASDQLYSLRTIVTADYKTGPWRAGFELYDSRAYGSRPGSAIGTGEVNTFEPVQAYVAKDFKDAFGPGHDVTAQAGRFTLNLGSRRLVAADDYRNTTNGYTGVKLDFKTPANTKTTLVYTLPQVRLPDDQAAILDNKVKLDRESQDLLLWGGTVTKPKLFGETNADISYFRFEEDDAVGRPTRNRALDSLSLRLIREPATGRLDYELETIYQSGELRASLAAAAPVLDVKAEFLHADLGYSFNSGTLGRIKARLSAEYDYASGDRPGGRFGRFDTLFGMRRADLAPAGIYAQIGRANISTPGLRLEVAPTPAVDGFIVYRGLWLAEATDAFSTTGVRDITGRSGRFAGTQVEGRARVWLIPKRLRAELNAAAIDKGRFLKTAPNAPKTGDTRYLSLALTQSF